MAVSIKMSLNMAPDSGLIFVGLLAHMANPDITAAILAHTLRNHSIQVCKNKIP